MAQIVMQEMHSIKLSIETAASTMSEVRVGFDNIQEQLNETVQQYKFLSDEGFGRSRVTAQQPVWTLTGRRVWGDPAQDYIFSRKYNLGADREVKAEVSYVANGNTYKIAFDAALCNLQELSGATEEDSAISVEIHCNGRPTLTVTPVVGG